MKEGSFSQGRLKMKEVSLAQGRLTLKSPPCVKGGVSAYAETGGLSYYTPKQKEGDTIPLFCPCAE